MHTGKFLWAGVIVAGLCGLAWPAAAQSQADNGSQSVAAITRPSKRAKMNFAAPGLIKNVPVEEGDVVKTGQLLITQDDAQDQLELKMLQMDAESDAAIRYSEAKMATQKVELTRTENMHKNKVATDQDLEEAQLKVKEAEVEVELAKLDHEQKKLKAEKQAERVRQMKLYALFDGVVEKIDNKAGEMSVPDPEKPAITVVKNDPLWVEMSLPVEQARALKLGDKLAVRYEGENNTKPAMAEVIYFAPEANAGAREQMVRLKMPNSEGRWSGYNVNVELPAKVAELGRESQDKPNG